MPKGRYWSRPSVIIYLSSIVVLVATLTFAIFRLDLRMKIVEMVHACDSDVDLTESVPDNVLLSMDRISLHAAARKSASKVSGRSFLSSVFSVFRFAHQVFILLCSFPLFGFAHLSSSSVLSLFHSRYSRFLHHNIIFTSILVFRSFGVHSLPSSMFSLLHLPLSFSRSVLTVFHLQFSQLCCSCS